MTQAMHPDLRTHIRNAGLLARLWRPSEADNGAELKTWIFPYVLQAIGAYTPLADLKQVENIIMEPLTGKEVLAGRVKTAIEMIKGRHLDLACQPVILTANYWDPAEDGRRKVQFAFNIESGEGSARAKKAILAAYILSFFLTNLLSKDKVFTLNNLIWERSAYYDPCMLTCTAAKADQEPWSAIIKPLHRNQPVWDNCMQATKLLKAYSVATLETILSNTMSPQIIHSHDDLTAMLLEPGESLAKSVREMVLDKAVAESVRKALDYSFGMKEVNDADIAATVLCTELLFHESGGKYLYCFPFAVDQQGCCTLNIFTRKKMKEHEALFFEMLTNAMFPRPMLQDFENELDELKIAQKVQRLSLKKPDPGKIEKILWLSADCKPAGGQQLGGDFYFYARGRHGQQWIIIGDPTGHGTVAALTMAKVLTYCKALVQYHRSPSILLEEIDDLLRQDTYTGGEGDTLRDREGAIYTTVAICAVVVDRPRKCFRIALAGDIPDPIYRNHPRPASQITRLKHGNKLGQQPAIDKAIDPETGEIWSTYHEESFSFDDNDVLLLFTDGALREESGLASPHKGIKREGSPVNDLCQLVNTYWNDLPSLVNNVIRYAQGETGEPTDDVAVFALRTDPSAHAKQKKADLAKSTQEDDLD